MNNENELWATIICDELYKSGVRIACIGAGSRSTPLTMALAKHEDIEALPFVDERTAAYTALGVAMESGTPAVLICTSGTALANFYPAVLEAYHSNIPLIVFSADRPPELRDSGANQAMNQISFFGQHTLFFQDIHVPDPHPTIKMINYLRTQIDKTVAFAMNGPVHLNFPFRKPLEPSKAERELDTSLLEELQLRGRGEAFLEIHSGQSILDDKIGKKLFNLIANRRGVVIIGSTWRVNSNKLLRFASNYSIPILAGPASQLRYTSSSSLLISAYDSIDKLPEVEFMILMGRETVSSKLLRYIDASNAIKIAISPHKLIDSSLTANHFFNTHEDAMLDYLNKNQGQNKQDWLDLWSDLEGKAIDQLNQKMLKSEFPDFILHHIVESIPSNSTVFIGNSLNIRLMSKYAPKSEQTLSVYSNRGLSGIDGNISIAGGISISCKDRVYAILGDLTLYHDSNALLNLFTHRAKVTIILVNNHGGGIFNKLPISNYDPVFTTFFTTPHDIDFRQICSAYGIEHILVDSAKELKNEIESSNKSDNSMVIEIITKL